MLLFLLIQPLFWGYDKCVFFVLFGGIEDEKKIFWDFLTFTKSTNPRSPPLTKPFNEKFQKILISLVLQSGKHVFPMRNRKYDVTHFYHI